MRVSKLKPYRALFTLLSTELLTHWYPGGQSAPEYQTPLDRCMFGHDRASAAAEVKSSARSTEAHLTLNMKFKPVMPTTKYGGRCRAPARTMNRWYAAGARFAWKTTTAHGQRGEHKIINSPIGSSPRKISPPVSHGHIGRYGQRLCRLSM